MLLSPLTVGSLFDLQYTLTACLFHVGSSLVASPISSAFVSVGRVFVNGLSGLCYWYLRFHIYSAQCGLEFYIFKYGGFSRYSSCF